MQDSILLSIDNSSQSLMKKRKSLPYTSQEAIANPTMKTTTGTQASYETTIVNGMTVHRLIRFPHLNREERIARIQTLSLDMVFHHLIQIWNQKPSTIQ